MNYESSLLGIHQHAKHMYTRMPSTKLIKVYNPMFSNILHKPLEGQGQGQAWHFIRVLPVRPLANLSPSAVSSAAGGAE